MHRRGSIHWLWLRYFKSIRLDDDRGAQESLALRGRKADQRRGECPRTRRIAARRIAPRSCGAARRQAISEPHQMCHVAMARSSRSAGRRVDGKHGMMVMARPAATKGYGAIYGDERQ